MAGIFSVLNYKDLLEKCCFELEKIKRLDSYPQYDYNLMNLIFDLNHLLEWYLKDKKESKKSKIKCVNTFNPFKSPYDVSSDFKPIFRNFNNFPTINIKQFLVRQLRNSVKHFKNNIGQKKEKNYIAVCGSEKAVCGSISCGEFNRFNYFIENESSSYNIESLCRELIAEWEQFIKLQNDY